MRRIYEVVRAGLYSPVVIVAAAYCGFCQGRMDSLDVRDDHDFVIKSVRRYQRARAFFRVVIRSLGRCDDEAAEDILLVAGFLPAERSPSAVARVTVIGRAGRLPS